MSYDVLRPQQMFFVAPLAALGGRLFQFRGDREPSRDDAPPGADVWIGSFASFFFAFPPHPVMLAKITVALAPGCRILARVGGEQRTLDFGLCGVMEYSTLKNG
jgi:hypothetical protein